MAALGGATALGRPSNYTTSGASDASPDGTPSQFILLRGLEPTVTEELLAKGVAKLYKPIRKSSPSLPSTSKKGNAKVASTTGDANLGAKEGSLRRVLLVRSRKTQESWRYGFAEFATVDVCFNSSTQVQHSAQQALSSRSDYKRPLVTLSRSSVNLAKGSAILSSSQRWHLRFGLMTKT